MPLIVGLNIKAEKSQKNYIAEILVLITDLFIYIFPVCFGNFMHIESMGKIVKLKIKFYFITLIILTISCQHVE